MVATVTQSSNLRGAPRAISPLLVERLLSLFDTIGAREPEPTPIAPRPRLAPPSSNVVPIPAHPLERAAEALAFVRRSGVSASVAETSHLGTRWWVSGHPNPLNATEIIALATKMGFGS